MGFSFFWSWFSALSSLLLMGGEVWCGCTENNMEIEGGHYTLTKNLEKGSMLVYHCPEGYYPYPTLTRLCQASGTWSPAPKRFLPQKCRLIECPDPNVLEYGNVSPPQEKYFVHNVTTYECYSGYSFRGSSRRVCLPNGKWSGSTPICSRDTGANCADPGIPPGATRTGNSFDIDDTVKYSCIGNLFLMGASDRVCQENGQWTNKEPACYYKHTYDTPQEVSEAFGGSIIDTLTTLESLNDTQEGRIIRISKNGTLNIYIAVDISESIEEPHIKNATTAVAKLISKIASFSVTPNYDIVLFSSELVRIVNITDFVSGTVLLKTVKDKLENFKTVERNSAGTDLNLIYKHFLEQMAVIKQQVGVEAFKEHRHVIIVFTDGAYNMGGSPAPTIEKIKHMVYMNYTGGTEVPERADYLDGYIFGIGAVVFDEDLQPLTVPPRDKDHYFRLKNLENLQKTFDEIIDENEVKGLCGLHVEYNTADDKQSIRKMYPWYAFIHVKEGRNCLGSLVTPRFVLTAAHCFRYGDLPEDVKVEFDGKHRIEFKVKNFTLHKNYDVKAKQSQGVNEFYDYDVALIQLEKDVTISSTLRPICLPCTQETSDALQLVGKSTCRQQEQHLLKTHLEPLSFLTRAEPSVRKKDVNAKLGDNRPACIQQALTAKGITTKDPTVAVTDNFLCTGGKFPFRDHIACTGDSGGAVFKNYEHRTIQVALVSWGTENLCTGGGLKESSDTSRDFHINLFRVVPFLKSVLGNDDQDEFAPLMFLE